MKREQWQELEARLKFPGATVKLQCDGYLVTLQVQLDRMRMVIAVYVDGWMRGEWMSTDCEQRRRFLRPRTVKPKPYTKAQIKVLGKKWCEQQFAKLTHTYYTPIWPTIPPLRRHFEKHNASVELAAEETPA
ncbi:hypothetical protein [Dyella lutea]|uniref:Uncharacterized protein n=1 Tax=Dyella lutea TaxID=2950441 RepID=A0ABT1FDA6_9GAMM|nr:hypothetical protein [Dyella lutea]MCP1375364.1 hypothetical protein [Dyella lutea]